MKRFPFSRFRPGVAALVALVALASVIAAAIGAAQAAAQSSSEFRLELNASLVSVDVGVYDLNQKAVTTLGRNDFQVYEDGVLQQVQSFVPVSGDYRILLLIDRSGSMSRYWSLLIKGLNTFMKTLRPAWTGIRKRDPEADYDSSTRSGTV